MRFVQEIVISRFGILIVEQVIEDWQPPTGDRVHFKVVLTRQPSSSAVITLNGRRYLNPIFHSEFVMKPDQADQWATRGNYQPAYKAAEEAFLAYWLNPTELADTK